VIPFFKTNSIFDTKYKLIYHIYIISLLDGIERDWAARDQTCYSESKNEPAIDQ
jgi:hypothetical protein